MLFGFSYLVFKSAFSNWTPLTKLPAGNYLLKWYLKFRGSWVKATKEVFYIKAILSHLKNIYNLAYV